MSFADAAAFRLTFGKYSGKTLDEIGSTDRGLLYLDWLRGERASQRPASDKGSCTDRALAEYLDDPTIAADVSRLARGRS
jgi:hypothetical protein